jgi:hypothetical protein
MHRIVAFAACALSLGACTASDLNALRFEKPQLILKLESEPPGAEARVSSTAASCKTPCEIPIEPAAGTLNVTFTLEGYHPLEVPVQVVEALGTAEPARATPNPVRAELEAPPKPAARRRPARKRSAPKKPAPKKPAAARSAPAPRQPAAAAPAPTPAETTTEQPPASAQPAPWPAPPPQQQPPSAPWPATPGQQRQQQ